jgi:hypothetical protein
MYSTNPIGSETYRFGFSGMLHDDDVKEKISKTTKMELK